MLTLYVLFEQFKKKKCQGVNHLDIQKRAWSRQQRTHAKQNKTKQNLLITKQKC